MYKSIILCLVPFTAAQVSQVHEAPPPPPVVLSTTKSGVIPSIPSSAPTPLSVDTLQGAIISPLPPQPGYTGLNGTATAQTNMPSATYRATLPPSMFNDLVGTTVSGYIQGVGSPDGVRFTINLSGLPSQAQYGPFNWHIHALPVPRNGNCTATTGHFDPTNRGEYVMCDASQPATCQAGDLAGKHGGKIVTAGNFSAAFVEPYLSTQMGSGYFFGGLSFVLHARNTTRLTCANFVVVNGTGGGSASSTGPGAPVFTGAAGRIAVGAGVVVGAVAAAFL